MAAVLLRVSLPGSDPPQVRLLGRIIRELWRRVLPAPRDGEVLLAVRTQQRYLVSNSSDQFKDSTMTFAVPGSWSLGARARRLPSCHRQGQAGSSMGAATTLNQRLVLEAAIVVWWILM